MYQRFIDNFGKYIPKTEGKYDMPIIEKVDSIVLLPLIPFNAAISSKHSDYGVHFFIDDYQFERVWNNPSRYISVLKRFKFVFSPDFSMYLNMPKVMQIWNKYRSQFIGSYLQSNGVNIIPTISWSDESSFEWCFDGVPTNGVIAVSSVGCLSKNDSLDIFLKGYKAMLDKLNPKLVLFYGSVPSCIDQTIVYNIKPYHDRFLTLKEGEL
jgi:hypothetical protein